MSAMEKSSTVVTETVPDEELDLSETFNSTKPMDSISPQTQTQTTGLQEPTEPKDSQTQTVSHSVTQTGENQEKDNVHVCTHCAHKEHRKGKYDKMQIACFILIGLFVLGVVLVLVGILVVPWFVGIPLLAIGGVCILFCIGFWIGVACTHRKKKNKTTVIEESV